VRSGKKLDHLVVRAQELGFLRRLPSDVPALRNRTDSREARITAERLDELKGQLLPCSTNPAKRLFPVHDGPLSPLSSSGAIA